MTKKRYPLAYNWEKVKRSGTYIKGIFLTTEPTEFDDKIKIKNDNRKISPKKGKPELKGYLQKVEDYNKKLNIKIDRENKKNEVICIIVKKIELGEITNIENLEVEKKKYMKKLNGVIPKNNEILRKVSPDKKLLFKKTKDRESITDE